MKQVPTDLLQEITRRLVAEFQPEQVILFGSHAWGTPARDSDLDLLVIVAESDLPATKRATLAYRSLRGVLAPMDILVRTRSEVERYRHVRASLERAILEKGRVLYGRSEAGTGPELAHQSPA